jgi:hypothetical protein
MIIARRNRDYFLTLPDCVVQEVTNTPDHSKKQPPKTATFTPKYTDGIKEIMKYADHLQHLLIYTGHHL